MTSQDSAPVNRPDKLRSSLMGARIAAMVSLGIELGLYDAMKDAGPLTSDDLASQTQYNERWVLEWLRGQAASQIVVYHGDGRFEFPKELNDLLANEDHLTYVGHQFQNAGANFEAVEHMPQVFRTGLGLSWDARGEPVAARIEKAFRNWYRQVLVPTALPRLDGVVSRLESGAKVADVGCGAGLALIEMAKAYPKAEFHGYETSVHALERAQKNSAEASITNVSFHNSEDEPLPADGSFDLICTFDCLHDMTRPDLAAMAIRSAIKQVGTWFIADVDGAATFEENLEHPMAPMAYAASLFSCLSSGLSEEGGAGLGTFGLPEPKMKELVEAAGFTQFRRVDLPSPINAYYEVRV